MAPKKYICPYCNTKHNEDECPNCCSAQLVKNPERTAWEQQQIRLTREKQEFEVRLEAEKGKKRHRIQRMVYMIFGFTFLFILMNFLMISCSMSRMISIFY